MLSIVRKHALLALCGTAALFVSTAADAASWDIVGGNDLQAANFPGYGTAVSKDNVINYAPSFVVDPTPADPAPWNTGGNLNALFTTQYNVSWFYIGSESADVIRFDTTGTVGSISKLETDANNNVDGAANDPGPLFLNTVTYNTTLTPFSFTDTNPSAPSNSTNGTNPNVTDNNANFILSYAELIGGQLVLSANPSDWIVIAFNDNGSPDDNHDDMIMAAFISDRGGENNFTPIPGALPLFGSVLGGGFLFRRLRKRRKGKEQSATA